MTGLAAALQFLTRVPIRLTEPVPHARVVPWFPMAGALIGLGVGAVAAAGATVVTPGLAAALAVTAGMLITGAFHEDGLADVADAFGGGWSIEQRLEILKDSRHGTYGVAALASSVVVRVTALAALETSAMMLAGAVAAHTLARTAAVGAMKVFPPARESGLGADAARSIVPTAFAGSVASGVAIAAAAVGWWVGPLTAAAGVAMLVVGRLAMAKIGGLAGDVLGAIEQVAEAAVLVTLVALVGRGQPYWG